MSAGAAGRRPSPSHLCPDPRIQVKQGGDNSVFYMQDLGLLGIFFFSHSCIDHYCRCILKVDHNQYFILLMNQRLSKIINGWLILCPKQSISCPDWAVHTDFPVRALILPTEAAFRISQKHKNSPDASRVLPQFLNCWCVCLF